LLKTGLAEAVMYLAALPGEGHRKVICCRPASPFPGLSVILSPLPVGPLQRDVASLPAGCALSLAWPRLV